LTAATLLPGSGKRLAIALVDSHEGVAPRVSVPMERCLDRGARHPGPLQYSQGASYDRSLHLGIPGFPAWVSQRKVGEHKAGDAALLDDVPRAAHDRGGNAVRLQVSRDQTHGLVADGSKRHEEHGVEAVLATPFEDLGSGALRRPALTVIGGHSVEAG